MQRSESTCSDSEARRSRLPFPTLSRNIAVTVLLPEQLERPWAQLPGSQHRPHLLNQKYLFPQWPPLVTPFLQGAQDSCGVCRMSSPRVGGAERQTTHSQVPSQPALTPHTHWPDEGCQGLNANVPRLWDPRPGEAGRVAHQHPQPTHLPGQLQAVPVPFGSNVYQMLTSFQGLY